MNVEPLLEESGLRDLRRPGDTVLQTFGLSMFLAGVPVCMALAEMGVATMPVGAEAGTEAVLKFARLFRPRAMYCTPSLADYLIETSAAAGVDLGDLGIERIFAGGERGAVMVYPLSVETVIQSFAPRATGQFRIVLSEPPPRVVPPMRLRIEHSPDIAGDGLRGLEAEIVEEMHRRLKIRPAIEWVRPHTLQRSMKKTRLLEKEYAR